LITIPALLPLYKRMRMDPYLLLMLVGTSASVVNMVPWGGPVGRAGAVLKVDPTVLWRSLIPLQFVAIFLLMGMAVILGFREKRRIAALGAAPPAGDSDEAPAVDSVPAPVRKSRGRFAFNAALALALIGLLVWGIVPAGLCFMIGASVALLANFPAVADQMARIKAHAPNALLMAAIILSAGSFLGIMNGTGMLSSIATDFVALMPAAVSRYVHIVVALLGVPLELVLNTDAFYFALVPVVVEIVASHGVAGIPAAHAMIIGNIIGTFISPFSPALWLALGLANCEMGRHIRYSLLWMWGFSLVLLAAAWAMGVFNL
jgi:CitMHS family citrate-Mg2+:H+ or citrate-Ca2+:H+ symporter